MAAQNDLMTAEEGAIKLSAECGYVVIGLPQEEMILSRGDRLREFAGGVLQKHFLEVGSITNRKDWDRQVLLIFGSSAADPNPRRRGQKFYRCKLLPLGESL